MKTIRMMVTGLMVAAMAVLTSGCFSYQATQSHNERAVEAQKVLKAHPQALQATVLSGGEPGLGLSVLDVLTPGYWAAWKANPGTMAAAAGGDLLTTAAAAAGTYYLTHSSSKIKSTAINITGNGNNVNYNGGGGSQNTSTDNSTKSGGE